MIPLREADRRDFTDSYPVTAVAEPRWYKFRVVGDGGDIVGGGSVLAPNRRAAKKYAANLFDPRLHVRLLDASVTS